MSQALGRLLVAVACCLLAHAAYSTYEHLSILKALGKPAGSIPSSILLESTLSLLLFIPSLSIATPKLEDITWRAEMARRSKEKLEPWASFAPVRMNAEASSAASLSR